MDQLLPLAVVLPLLVAAAISALTPLLRRQQRILDSTAIVTSAVVAGLLAVIMIRVWPDSDDLALESSREWKGTLADEPYAEDVSDPAQVGEIGESISDRTFRMLAMCPPTPAPMSAGSRRCGPWGHRHRGHERLRG